MYTEIHFTLGAAVANNSASSFYQPLKHDSLVEEPDQPQVGGAAELRLASHVHSCSAQRRVVFIYSTSTAKLTAGGYL